MRHSFHSARILRWMRKPLISIVSAGAMLFFYPMYAFSAPTDGLVVKGQANITQSGASTIIDQGSARAVIDWRSFNINANEMVRFNQLSQSSVALNRITGGNPTAILGQLSANGRVFLVNPNGILFGQGAKIDVAGLVASTLTVNADDFMNGKNLFTQDLSKANSYIVNQGDIRIADNGFCFLVAPGVRNEGTILAQLGKVVMASGNSLTLDFNGDGLMTYTLSGKVLDNVIGPDGKPMGVAVENTGKVSAKGGDIVMVGNAGKDVFSSVVNNSGIVEATSLSVKGGTVTLSGGEAGIARNTGSIDVSAAEAGAKAGHVAIEGQYAGNFGTITAKGATDSNGGLVELNSSTHTLLGSDSKIDVSGQDNSSAGSVLLRSDNHTTFNGQVIARGGDIGGNGGFVDVSSLGQVDILGTVDAISPNGRMGTMLIDPTNITISTSGASLSSGSVSFSDNAPEDASFTPSSLDGIHADVTLQASNDITVSNNVTLGTSGAGLTLRAGRDVNIKANITTTNGAVTIKANDQGATAAKRSSGDGDITMDDGTTINAGSKDITLTVDIPSTFTSDSPSDPYGKGGGIKVANLTSTGNVTLTSVKEIGTVGSSLITGDTVTLTTRSPLDTSKSAHVDLYTVDSNIGTSLAKINTSANTLSATAENGSVYINETDAVTIGTILSKYKGVKAMLNGSGDVTAVTVTGSTGSYDAIVTAGGDTTLGSMGASGKAELTVTGKVIDGNSGNINMIASSVKIAATTGIGTQPIVGNGTESTPQTPADAIEIMSQSLTSAVSGTSGDVYLAFGSKSTLGTVTAATGDVGISSSGGSLMIGAGNITAGGGDITIAVNNGILLSGGGTVKAPHVRLVARDGIGLSVLGTAIPIATEATSLVTEVTTADAVTLVNSSGTIGSVTTLTNDGEVAIHGAGTSGLTFVDSSNALAADAATLISFANSGAGIALGSFTTGELSLTASGAITDANVDTMNITSPKVTLTGSSIGASGDSIETSDAGTMNLSATAGGVYVANTGSLTLTASAAGSAKDVKVTNAGALTLKTVNATGTADISATGPSGAIIDGNGSSVNITAASATLSAGSTIGTSGDSIETSINTNLSTNAGPSMTLTETGGSYIKNTGSLALEASHALNSDGDLAIDNTGTLELWSIKANHATLTSTAAITDGNGSSTNIEANSATLTASGIGDSNDRLETKVSTLNLSTTSSDIYISNTGETTLTATANGNGADIDFANTGNLTLMAVRADGDTVTLDVTGDIIDGNDTPSGKGMNVTAKTLKMTATGTIGTLEYAVSQLDAPNEGGTPLEVTNSEPLAVTAATIAGGGTFTAPTITILDFGNISDDPVHIADVNNQKDTANVSGSLTLNTTTGNIIFLDTRDEINATGSITINAGAQDGNSGAVAIIGNLTTSGGAITVSADSHISIGRLDTGVTGGKVTVHARNGMIIDGNGDEVNIVAGSAELIATTPTANEAQTNLTQATADASAAFVQGAIATNTYSSSKVIAESRSDQEASRQDAADNAESDFNSKESSFNSADNTASQAELAAQILSDIASALGIVADTAELVSASAQIIPLVGDGGASVAFTVVKWVANAANLGALIAGETAGALRSIADEKEADMVYAQNVLDNKNDLLDQAKFLSNEAAEKLSVDTKIMQNSLVASAAANMLKAQALTANKYVTVDGETLGYYSPNAIGNPGAPLGVNVKNGLDIVATNSNVYVKTEGLTRTALGDISVGNNRVIGPSAIVVNGTGDIAIVGELQTGNFENDIIRISTESGKIYQDGSGLINSPNFIASATDGIGYNMVSGSNTGVISTHVDNFSATGGTGGVSISNDKSLNVTRIVDYSAYDYESRIYAPTNLGNDYPVRYTNRYGIEYGAAETYNADDTTTFTGVTATGATSAIQAAGILTIKQPVSATGGGNILLKTTGNGNYITADTDVDVTSDSGNISVLSSDNVVLNAGADITTGATGTIDIDAAGSDGTGSINLSPTSNVKAGNGNIRLHAATDINLGQLISTSGDVAVLTDNGSIIDNDETSPENNDISSDDLILKAGTAIGAADNHIETTVARLSSSSSSGSTYITEANGVTVDALGVSVKRVNSNNTTTATDVSQADLATGTNGNLVLQTTNGSITLNDGNGNGVAVSTNGSGSILLDANGNGSDIVAGENADIVSGTGHITLTAADAITLGSNVDVTTATAGTVSLDAEGGALTMDGSAHVTATDSSARLNSKGDLTVGNVTATNVSLVSDEGAIINAASSEKNVTATNLRIEADDAIGVSNRHLTTNVSTVSAKSTGTNSAGIYITEDSAVEVNTVKVSVTQFNGDATTTTVTDDSQSDLATGHNGNIVLATTNGSITLSDGTDVAGSPGEDNTDGYAVSANGSGNVTIDAAGILTANAAVVSGSGNILITGGTGIMTAAAGDISTGGSGKIAMTSTTGDMTLYGRETTYAGSITLTADAGAININDAVASTSGDITVTGDSVLQNASITTGSTGAIEMTADNGSLTVNGRVDASGTGNVTVTASSLLTVNAAISSGSGDLSLTGGTGVVHDAAGDLVTSGRIGVTATTGDLTMADGTVFTTDGGQVDLLAAHDVTLGKIVSTSGTVNVTATSGLITDATNAETPNISTSGTANLVAAGGIGSGNPGDINVHVGILNARTNGTDMWLTSDQDLHVGQVTTGGTVSGSVNLTVNNGSLLEADSDTGADIAGNTLNLVVTGASSTIGTLGNALEIDAAKLNASTQGRSIYLHDTDGGVAIGLVSTGSADQGTVVLSASNGSITEFPNDADADIVARNVTLSVEGNLSDTVGSFGNMLEVSASNLHVDNPNGNIYVDLNNTAGTALNYELPAGMSLNTENLPQVIVLGTQIIGGDSIDELKQAQDQIKITQESATGSGIVFRDVMPPSLLMFGSGNSMTLNDNVIE